MEALRHIGQGRTADVYEYQQGKIIKLFRSGFPEEAIHQEFVNSQFAYSAGISTPRPFEIVDLGDRRALVFQKISGRSLLHVMTGSPWLINRCSRTLAQLHYGIHIHRVPEGLRRQKQALTDHIRTAPLLTEAEKEKIVDYLDQLPSGDRLCHGDFHPDNVMVGDKNWIMDWTTGMSGNPAGDVARSVILFDLGTMPDGTPKVMQAAIHFLRKRLRAEYLRTYVSMTGLAYSDIDSWILPVAAARLVEWIPQQEKDNLLGMIKGRLRGL